ncbi:hypothetical protein [Halovivax gelatinilyticus]|uniref:hypothetical protein n=1 Tax=Halovivax gelatinilyticus TaxID=2961597 RepID=UPI0020CA4C37|nr:hypothetical protein [Halovivax gelatinilyticus]
MSHTDSPADEMDDADRDASTTTDPSLDLETLATQRDVLAAENRRLRTEYARAQRARYRRTALGLAAFGLLAIAGALVFPAGRDVLLALAGVGLIGGLLTYTLAPGHYVAADVGERVYAAQARNADALATELDLRDEPVYLPGEGTARLFVPQRADPTDPDPADGPIVTDPDSRGLLLEPTGRPLYEAFERAVTGEPASDPPVVATQLADAIVEQFELARSATVDAEVDRLTVAVSNSAFGDLDRFDHPIPSLMAVGLATVLDRPVTVDVDPGDDRSDWLVTCRFEG